MKAKKYGIYYYCERQVVGEEVLLDFCAPIGEPDAVW
jgi:hypothetical protein